MKLKTGNQYGRRKRKKKIKQQAVKCCLIFGSHSVTLLLKVSSPAWIIDIRVIWISSLAQRHTDAHNTNAFRCVSTSWMSNSCSHMEHNEHVRRGDTKPVSSIKEFTVRKGEFLVTFDIRFPFLDVFFYFLTVLCVLPGRWVQSYKCRVKTFTFELLTRSVEIQYNFIDKRTEWDVFGASNRDNVRRFEPKKWTQIEKKERRNHVKALIKCMKSRGKYAGVPRK